MRWRNFLIHMGAALVIGVAAFFISRNIIWTFLIIVINLIWALISDRKTLSGEKLKVHLETKYPMVKMPDTYHSCGQNISVLHDSYVKETLLRVIPFGYYCSAKKKQVKILDKYYSSIAAGNYTLQQNIVSDKIIVPDSDGPDDHFIKLNNSRYKIEKETFARCEIGDRALEAVVKDCDGVVAVFWFDRQVGEYRAVWKCQMYEVEAGYKRHLREIEKREKEQ